MTSDVDGRRVKTNELVFRLDATDIEAALVEFTGREIRFMVDYLGLPQSELGRRAGVSASSIGNLYHGRTKHPQIRTVFPILAMLDLEFDPARMAIVRRSAEVVPLVPRARR